MNPVNCFFHLSFSLPVLYLYISIFCLKFLSPCFEIKPRNWSFSQLKYRPLGQWGNIDVSFPLRCLQARDSQLDQHLNSETLFYFFPSSISRYGPIWRYTCTEVHITSPHWCVWLSETKLSLPADILQSSGEEFISEILLSRLHTYAIYFLLWTGSTFNDWFLLSSHAIQVHFHIKLWFSMKWVAGNNLLTDFEEPFRSSYAQAEF